MRRASILLFAPLLLLALLPACRTGPAPIQTSGETTLALKPEGKRTEETVELGRRLTVTLPPGDTATHRWFIAQHDSRFLKQLTPIAVDAGVTTVAFAVIRPGTTRMRFVLLPIDSLREAVPIDAHDLVLRIE